MSDKSTIRIIWCSLILCTLELLLIQAVWGYSYEVRTGCGSGVIKSEANIYVINNNSFPAWSELGRAVESAMGEFNVDVPGSGWWFGWGYAPTYLQGYEDTVNEVSFASYSLIGTHNPALTQSWYSYAFDPDLPFGFHACWYRKAYHEADVLFNSTDFTWNPSLTVLPGSTCYFGGECNLKAVAIHEFGHAAGLGHENRWLATMGMGMYAYFGTDRNLPMLHSDDKAGLRFLYGIGTTGADVAVTSKKWTGSTGEYGTIGDVDQSTDVNRANPWVFTEYTLENHGTNIVNANIGFYVYKDYAGRWELLGTQTVSGIPPGYVGTHSIYAVIQVQQGLPKYSYTFKIVVDYDNQLNETNESNNEFQLPHQINIDVRPSLTLVKTGTGSGIVTSAPTDLYCGTTCAGASSYFDPSAVTLTATPSSGSIFTGWVGGRCSGMGTCTVTLSADTTVTASFAIANNIATTTGLGGSISPGSVAVPYGGSQAFTITPNTGYHITGVLVDGVSVGAVGTYTFSTVTAPHTISASFAINTYTITATSGSGGTITPSGTILVNYGGSQSYNMTPVVGNMVADVLVDGHSVGAVTTYNLSNITADHSIASTFVCSNPPIKVKMAGVAYLSLQAAYDAASDNAVIQIVAMTLIESLTVNRSISVTLDGGFSCDFTTKVGSTNLKGMITTSAGTTTVKDFILLQ